MPQFLTNRGKLLLIQGDWDDAAAGDYLIELCTTTTPGTVPAAIDTQAEANPLNFVSDLLALSGVSRATWPGYAAIALTRSAATEDDANNRVNMDAADVTFAAAAVVTTLTHCWGGFIYKTGGSDAARALLSVFSFATPVALNGSGILIPITDVIRAS